MKPCKCGSTSFWLTEKELWKCVLEKNDNGENELYCFHKENEIDKVICSKCGKKTKNDYEKINFN